MHTASWPRVEEYQGIATPEHKDSLEAARELLSLIHHEKSKQQKSLKWPVALLEVSGESASLEAAKSVLPDLERAGRLLEDAVRMKSTEVGDGARFLVRIELSSEGPQ